MQSSYINKTLVEGEKVILFTRMHWMFWFWPAVSLFVPPLGLIVLFFAFFVYLSTENAVTNKRIILKKGFIRTNTDELRNEKIENIQIKQSIIGRIFQYGNLEFRGIGGSPVIFKKIPDPISFKKEVEKIIYKSGD